MVCSEMDGQQGNLRTPMIRNLSFLREKERVQKNIRKTKKSTVLKDGRVVNREESEINIQKEEIRRDNKKKSARKKKI